LSYTDPNEENSESLFIAMSLTNACISLFLKIIGLQSPNNQTHKRMIGTDRVAPD